MDNKQLDDMSDREIRELIEMEGYTEVEVYFTSKVKVLIPGAHNSGEAYDYACKALEGIEWKSHPVIRTYNSLLDIEMCDFEQDFNLGCVVTWDI